MSEQVLFQVMFDDHDSFYQIGVKALRGIFDVPTADRFDYIQVHGKPASVDSTYGAICIDAQGELWKDSLTVDMIKEVLEENERREPRRKK